jgi:hypothetical protein
MLCTEAVDKPGTVFFCGYCGRYRPIEGRLSQTKHGWKCAACVRKIQNGRGNDKQ